MKVSIIKFCFAFTIMFCCIVFFGHSSVAQDGIVVEADEVLNVNAEEDAEAEGGVDAPVKAKLPEFDPIKKTYDIGNIPSLFFTLKQHQALQNAKADRERRGVVRPPSQAELDDPFLYEQEQIQKVYVRELALGGIVYNNEDDWAIWLNEQRVTPDAIPKEVLNLKVYKDFIEIRWFDEKTDNVFPIRLRAHQRFNMDARIFLTGE